MQFTATIEKPSDTSMGYKVLLGVLFGLVLVPTLLVWAAVGSTFFGYRGVNAWGTSMEPALRNGDALWVKRLDVADVKVGDIVTIVSPSDESITHRVVKIEPLSEGSYILAIKGDANHFTEEWEISDDWTVALVVTRVSFGGYVLEFLDSIFGNTLIIGALVTLVVIWVRRRRITNGDRWASLSNWKTAERTKDER